MKTPSPTQEEIAQRARELWQSRGQPVGRDDEIWLDAEQQLTMAMVARNAPAPAGANGASAETERLRGEMASESEVEFQITPAIPDDEAIKAALQKKEARAPKVSHKKAPHAKPVESGKPLWNKPHSS